MGSSPVNRATVKMECEKIKLNILDLKEKKASKERLAMVAVGEFCPLNGRGRGVDIIGVGDSLGMTLMVTKIPFCYCDR